VTPLEIKFDCVKDSFVDDFYFDSVAILGQLHEIFDYIYLNSLYDLLIVLVVVFMIITLFIFVLVYVYYYFVRGWFLYRIYTNLLEYWVLNQFLSSWPIEMVELEHLLH
jgi:hypothetical protein